MAVVDANHDATDPAAPRTTYNYTATGEIQSESDPLGKTLVYRYDAGGRLTEQRLDLNANKVADDSDRLVLTYAWSGDGKLLSKSDSQVDPSSPRLTSLTYYPSESSNVGRLWTATAAGVTQTFDYYANGWLKSVSDGSRSVEYEYDALGRRELLTIKEGTTVLHSLDTVYDPTTKAFKEIVSSAAGTFTFGVDPYGRRGTLAAPHGITAFYGYHPAMNWLTSLVYKDAAGNALLDLAYPEHDAVGNRKVRSEDDLATDYAYDATDQLLQAQTGSSAEIFTYDPVGNRKGGPTVKDSEAAAYTHDDANRMLEGRKDDYSYDDFGNRQYRYLDVGHSKYWQHRWDGENQLIEAKLMKGAQTLRIVTFKYDPFGRRVEKKVTGLAPQVPVPLTTRFVYDGEDIVLQTVSNGTTTTTTHFVHGPGIDEPLARVAGTQKYFYHADGLGSIVAISDSSKAVVQRYAYDSFGMVISTNPAFENAYTFTGREWDKETGLYYYRARYYDPMEGRFISKDPIGFAGGDVNLYRYVGNEVVGWTDPMGKWGENVHSGKYNRIYGTEKWANDMGFSIGESGIIGDANSAVDNYMSWSPVVGIPGRHFDMSVGNVDSRDLFSAYHLTDAINLYREGKPCESLKSLGRGLHSVQDKIAHMGWIPLLVHPNWYDNIDKRPLALKETEINTKQYLEKYLRSIGR